VENGDCLELHGVKDREVPEEACFEDECLEKIVMLPRIQENAHELAWEERAFILVIVQLPSLSPILSSHNMIGV
jgi:hypothetical protein